MHRWWLLLISTTLWMALGYALMTSRADQAPAVCRPCHPIRIVSMAPNLTEILFALGLGPNVVGVTQDSDYPPAAKDKPRVGTFWQPDIEAVIATRPDLVVTETFEQHRDLARRLQRMGYNSLMVEMDTIRGLYEGILAIGQATGSTRQAQTLCENIRAQIGQLVAATDKRRRAKVLWVVQREPLRVAGRTTFINEMIELAGGENAVGQTLHVYPAIGAEQVIAAAPEVIIEPALLPAMIAEQRAQALSYWSRFSTLPAVRTGRIHVIDGDLISRLGPRLPKGIRTIAGCLDPALFGD